MVDAMINDILSFGSPGVEEVRWLKPVRPNDTLHACLTIVEAVPSKSRADLGILKSKSEVFNQFGEHALTLNGVPFFGCFPSRVAQIPDAAKGDECVEGPTN
jgi:acyl dehydratase